MPIQTRVRLLRAVLTGALAATASLVTVTVSAPAATAQPVGGDPATRRDPADVDRLTRVEAYLREHMRALKAPGLAYAIVRGEEVIAQAAWGVDGDGQPVTPQTPFVLGSTAKSFTALAVMQLVETGRVELDTPVREYLPWFRLADEDAAGRITIRQLLLHTSGMPGVATLGLTDRYDNTPGALERSVRELATLRPTATPGERHQYSDANYMVLGALVEAVTGKPFGAHLREAVLDPLAMTHTAATGDDARDVGVPPGYRYYLGRPQRFAPPFDTSGVPYGFLAASLEDVSHYVISQLNAGRYRGTRLLSPEGMAQMHTGQVATGPSGSYGFGWRVSTLSGTDIGLVWHAGAVANSFSHFVLVPESDLAVVVLSNVYSVAMDGPMTSAAFNAVRILHGHAPSYASPDPTFRWVLLGLLAGAGVLLVALVWSLAHALRRWRGAVAAAAGARRRILFGTAAWTAGCAAVAVAAGWILPASWDGAGLTQVLLFAPDIGHAIIAVDGLAAALALTRVGVAARALTGPGRAARDELESAARACPAALRGD